MALTDLLVQRNAAHAKAHPGVIAPVEPALRALVLACGDHRADPAHVLGLEPNEVVVLRNVGGRVTPEILDELVLLVTVGAAEGIASEGFELVVMHHTDCGITRLGGPEHHGMLAGYFGVDPAEVPDKHVTDPFTAVRVDVEGLRANPLISATLIVSGLVYDVGSGLVEVVCPPAPVATD
jgi:carbonic anhydrase